MTPKEPGSTPENRISDLPPGKTLFKTIDMARKTRIEFPGAFYHVLDRGDRREAIYGDDEDRRSFLTTLEEVCE
jgi:hypothetical protein